MPSIEQVLTAELTAIDRRRAVIDEALTRLRAIDNIASNGQHRPTGRKAAKAAEPVKRRRRRRRRNVVAAANPVAAPAATLGRPRKRTNGVGVSEAVIDYVRTRNPQGARVGDIARAVGRSADKISTIMWRLKKMGQLKLVDGFYTTA